MKRIFLSLLLVSASVTATLGQMKSNIQSQEAALMPDAILTRSADNLGASDAMRFTSFSQAAKLISNDGSSSDQFGWCIGISGDRAVLSSPGSDYVGGDHGAAYIFRKENGIWVQEAKLLASDGAAGDNFATEVAIDGDTVVVSAWRDDIGANTDQGSAYIFTRSGITWTQQAKITATDGASDDNFGLTADISGETVLIGAYHADISGRVDQGAAYVFVRNGTTWTQQAKLIANDGITDATLGTGVALEGNSAVVGAHTDSFNSINYRGSAYVFVRSGTTWTQQAKLIASDGESIDTFGRRVAINGDTVLVGASHDDVNGNMDQGSAYVFARNGTTWTQQAKLVAGDGTTNDQFSFSDLVIKGDTIFVGAFFSDVGSNVNQGSVYVFTRFGSAWQQTAKIIAPDLLAGARFGTGIGLSGNTLIIGAHYDTIGVNTNQGSAYVFNAIDRPPAFDFDGDRRADISVFRPAPSAIWYLLLSGTGSFSQLSLGAIGDRLAPADFDGDKRADLAVFRDGTWQLLQSSNNSYSSVQFGTTGDLPLPGDFDGDGKADICVFRPANGIWYRLNSSNNQFVAFQFGQNGDVPLVANFDGDPRSDIAIYRPSTGLWAWQRSSDGQVQYAQFGQSSDIAVAEDYDGDGKTDVAIFRPNGGTWHLLNSSNGQLTIIQFGQNGDVPVPTDYDGDGRADIAVFRAGIWYKLNSSNGQFNYVQFGISTDKPVPAAFLQ